MCCSWWPVDITEENVYQEESGIRPAARLQFVMEIKCDPQRT